ncbi:DNA-binding protein [Bacteroides sp. An19]|nr:DNA-binding protein [Bacteroides sp. An19]
MVRNETGKGKTILSLTRLSVKNYLSDNLPADTHAVLRALPNIMADFMKESRAVHFEGLGWFRYTTVSAGNGVATKEEVSSDQITGLRVQFTPDRTRNMSGGYTRALIADEGITFMEWLGKESDETQVPEEYEDEGQTENPLE